MRDDDRIDLSPLDPFADPARLERAVRSIVDRAVTRADGPLSGRPASGSSRSAVRRPLAREIVAQGRRALVAACAAAAAAWILVTTAPGSGARTSPDPIDILSASAESGDVPRGLDVLYAMEAPHAR